MRLPLILCGLFYCLQAAAGGLPAAGEARVLDYEQSILRYSAKDLDRSSGKKFLLFEIVEVINPRSIPLNFIVHYQKPGKEQLYLGSFALYPNNNPGRFIVATQRMIDGEGEVVLSLSPTEPEIQMESVRLLVGPVRLIDQLEPADSNHAQP